MNSYQKVMKISEVKVEEDLYPRMHSDFVTVARYINAMKSGATFPPIKVAKNQAGKHILIDGRHRMEATMACKNDHIQAEVFEGLTDKEIYLEAVKANINHGRQFSTQEVTQIAITLQDFDMDLEEISEIIRIPVDGIKPFVAKRMVRESETGKNFALKKPLQRVLSGLPISQQEGLSQKQWRLDGRAQIKTVEALSTLFRNGWIEDSETLRGKLKTLKRFIDAHLAQYEK